MRVGLLLSTLDEEVGLATRHDPASITLPEVLGAVTDREQELFLVDNLFSDWRQIPASTTCTQELAATEPPRGSRGFHSGTRPASFAAWLHRLSWFPTKSGNRAA
uniref:hypothetical protein n=1 Tax=Enterococcus faecalis TaxID=1351 RepID=UPI0034E443CF